MSRDSWLDGHGDPGAATLSEALEQARLRGGDEIARRRVWARLADAELPRRLSPRGIGLLTSGVLLAGVAGALLVIRGGHPPGSAQVIATVEPPALAAAPPVANRPAEPTEIGTALVGPAIVRTQAGERKRVRLQGGATADLGANATLSVDAGHRPTVEQGRVSWEVAHQPPGDQFTVAAGRYIIAVVGTKFHVRVLAGKDVSVDVDEGVVEVWRGSALVRRLGAYDSWQSGVQAEARGPRATRRSGDSRSRARLRTRGAAPVGPRLALADVAPGKATSSLAVSPGLATVSPSPGSAPQPQLAPAPASSPTTVRPVDPFKEAQAALAAGDPARAMDLLASLARGQGPTAENALYEMGRVQRDRLLRARDAVRTWNRYRERFPRGLLRAEADLSILETLVKLGDDEAALKEAQAFLRRHPGSERRSEIARLEETLRRASR